MAAPLFPSADARLRGIAEAAAAVPLALQLVCHSLHVTSALAPTWAKRPYLQSIVVTFLAAYGGGLVAAVLLGEASSAVKSDLLVLAHCAAWYAYNYVRWVEAASSARGSKYAQAHQVQDETRDAGWRDCSSTCR